MTLTREEKIEILMEHYHDYDLYEGWWESQIDYWQEERLPEEGFEDAEIFFSGFWSQGDGASFKSSVNVHRFLKNHAMEICTNYVNNIFNLRDLINATGNYQYIDLTAHIDQDGHYCHENTMYVTGYEYTIEEDDNISQQIQEFLEYKLEDWILEHARDLARDIYKCLESEHEDRISAEQVIESLQANNIIDENLDFLDQADNVYPEEEVSYPKAA